MRVVANLFHLRRRINRPAPHIHRVFQADQRRLRVVINFRPDARFHLLPRQNPVLPPPPPPAPPPPPPQSHDSPLPTRPPCRLLLHFFAFCRNTTSLS